MFEVLRITFAQALRSIILVLLPISFISLITWATAGSSSGNTADPIRGGIWFLLVAHQIPLQLSISDIDTTGALSFLPIGAMALPVLAIRSGFKRVLSAASEANRSTKRNYLLLFALNYAIIGSLISLPALGKTVITPLYIVAPALFIFSLIFAFTASGLFPKHNSNSPWQLSFQIALSAIALLIGFGAIFFGISLILHFDLLINLTKIIEPGIFGGFTLLLLQILYTPNFSIMALSYISGAGLSINDGSLVSPFTHRLDEIPAIPALGALPTKSYPLMVLASFLVILIGLLIFRFANSKFNDSKMRRDFIAITFALVGAGELVLARASGGEFISPNLSSVGPIWWAMPLLILLELSIGALLGKILLGLSLRPTQVNPN